MILLVVLAAVLGAGGIWLLGDVILRVSTRSFNTAVGLSLLEEEVARIRARVVKLEGPHGPGACGCKGCKP